MSKQAIIFGSIGTVVETSELQRAAFNQAFEEADLDWHWSEEDYIKMLAKSGGRQRISDYADARGDVVSAVALHDRKTEIFDRAMVEQGLTPRLGVVQLMQFAKESGIKLGFASTTSAQNIAAIFEALDGALHRSSFDFVGDNESVTNGKPDPEIYYRTMTGLGVTATQALAIEDTPVSMKAAHAADIDCVAFPGAYARSADFKEASRIVETLEPQGLPGLSTEASGNA